jgi:DNA-binding NtrC family response regulator
MGPGTLGSEGIVTPSTANDRPCLLVADDAPDVRTAVRLLLAEEGIDVEAVHSPAGALAAAAERRFDAALLDLNYARDTTSGGEGLELLERLRRQDPDLPVVVMTAWATVDLAVQAMRAGARDFVEKPWENARLAAVVRNQVELGRALRRARRLEAENAILRDASEGADEEPIVGTSAAMAELLATAARVSGADAPVLITGENGTGKSLLARWIHRRSGRVAGPFVEVNAGAIPEGLFESEMFGHVKGAFTDAREGRAGRFELADGGTLFLDEVGNLPPGAQSKLLRVLDRGEFEPVGSSRTRRADVRIVAATNADLAALVSQGRFRQDLYFRMNLVELRLPPLRDRREDVQALAAAALARAAARYRRTVEGFAPGAVAALEAYAWPGNVRELQNVIERAVLLATGPRLEARDLRLAAPAPAAQAGLEEMSLEDAERALLRAALRRTGGNVLAAAQSLGLSRSAMYRRMEKLGIRSDG